jgi:hypothetical protein
MPDAIVWGELSRHHITSESRLATITPPASRLFSPRCAAYESSVMARLLMITRFISRAMYRRACARSLKIPCAELDRAPALAERRAQQMRASSLRPHFEPISDEIPEDNAFAAPSNTSSGTPDVHRMHAASRPHAILSVMVTARSQSMPQGRCV